MPVQFPSIPDRQEEQPNDWKKYLIQKYQLDDSGINEAAADGSTLRTAASVGEALAPLLKSGSARAYYGGLGESKPMGVADTSGPKINLDGLREMASSRERAAKDQYDRAAQERAVDMGNEKLARQASSANNKEVNDYIMQKYGLEAANARYANDQAYKSNRDAKEDAYRNSRDAANDAYRNKSLEESIRHNTAMEGRANKPTEAELKRQLEISALEASANKKALVFDQLRDLRKGTNITGPVLGRIGKAMNWTNSSVSTDFDQLNVNQMSMLNQYIKDTTGASATESEMRRLEAVMPSVADSDALFENKLQALEKESQNIVNERRQAYGLAPRSWESIKKSAGAEGSWDTAEPAKEGQGKTPSWAK